MKNFGQFIYNTYLDILIERLPDGHPRNKDIGITIDRIPIRKP